MHFMGFGYGYPSGFSGWIMMVLWWVLIFAGIVVVVRWVSDSRRDGGGVSPLDILKERYAKGEIDKKEFEERKRTLES